MTSFTSPDIYELGLITEDITNKNTYYAKAEGTVIKIYKDAPTMPIAPAQASAQAPVQSLFDLVTIDTISYEMGTDPTPADAVPFYVITGNLSNEFAEYKISDNPPTYVLPSLTLVQIDTKVAENKVAKAAAEAEAEKQRLADEVEAKQRLVEEEKQRLVEEEKQRLVEEEKQRLVDEAKAAQQKASSTPLPTTSSTPLPTTSANSSSTAVSQKNVFNIVNSSSTDVLRNPRYLGVSLLYSGGGAGGGSGIPIATANNQDIIYTAAHCLKPDLGGTRIIVGCMYNNINTRTEIVKENGKIKYEIPTQKSEDVDDVGIYYTISDPKIDTANIFLLNNSQDIPNGVELDFWGYTHPNMWRKSKINDTVVNEITQNSAFPLADLNSNYNDWISNNEYKYFRFFERDHTTSAGGDSGGPRGFFFNRETGIIGSNELCFAVCFTTGSAYSDNKNINYDLCISVSNWIVWLNTNGVTPQIANYNNGVINIVNPIAAKPSTSSSSSSSSSSLNKPVLPPPPPLKASSLTPTIQQSLASEQTPPREEVLLQLFQDLSAKKKNEQQSRQGVPNFGNTCWANGLYQFLYDIEEFKEGVLSYNSIPKMYSELINKQFFDYIKYRIASIKDNQEIEQIKGQIDKTDLEILNAAFNTGGFLSDYITSNRQLWMQNLIWTIPVLRDNVLIELRKTNKNKDVVDTLVITTKEENMEYARKFKSYSKRLSSKQKKSNINGWPIDEKYQDDDVIQYTHAEIGDFFKKIFKPIFEHIQGIPNEKLEESLILIPLILFGIVEHLDQGDQTSQANGEFLNKLSSLTAETNIDQSKIDIDNINLSTNISFISEQPYYFYDETKMSDLDKYTNIVLSKKQIAEKMISFKVDIEKIEKSQAQKQNSGYDYVNETKTNIQTEFLAKEPINLGTCIKPNTDIFRVTLNELQMLEKNYTECTNKNKFLDQATNTYTKRFPDIILPSKYLIINFERKARKYNTDGSEKDIDLDIEVEINQFLYIKIGENTVPYMRVNAILYPGGHYFYTNFITERTGNDSHYYDGIAQNYKKEWSLVLYERVDIQPQSSSTSGSGNSSTSGNIKPSSVAAGPLSSIISGNAQPSSVAAGPLSSIISGNAQPSSTIGNKQIDLGSDTSDDESNTTNLIKLTSSKSNSSKSNSSKSNSSKSNSSKSNANVISNSSKGNQPIKNLTKPFKQ